MIGILNGKPGDIPDVPLYRAEKLRRGSVLRYLGLLVISISKQMTLKMTQFESRYLFSGVPRQ